MDSLAIVVDDLETGATWRYAFLKSPIRVGRSELSDVPLPVPYVSSCHAVVQFDGEGVRYIDLASLNGSELDGAPLQPNVPVALRDDSEVRIGHLRLRCARAEATEVTRTERPVTQFSQRLSELGLAAPAGAASSSGSTPAQAEAVEQALLGGALDLDLQYASYRASWEHLRSTVEQTGVGLEEPARALLLSKLAEKYPELGHEPEFRALAGGPEAPKPSPGAGAATGFLRAFAQSYLPASEKAPEDAEKVFARIAEILEAFARSFVELRKGREEFGREMGVAVPTDGALERSRDSQQLLAYLLDLGAQGRAAELQSSFGDLMLHQVALLNGIVEGARGLLGRLDPEAVSASAKGIRLLKAAAQWEAYEQRWHELADDPDGVSDAIFGAEFARAYTSIVGRRVEENNGASKGPRTAPRPGKSPPRRT
ncbi:MAG: type VI secretion system-associated FHA domain protein [Myxococcales bacterium]